MEILLKNLMGIIFNFFHIDGNSSCFLVHLEVCRNACGVRLTPIIKHLLGLVLKPKSGGDFITTPSSPLKILRSPIETHDRYQVLIIIWY